MRTVVGVVLLVTLLIGGILSAGGMDQRNEAIAARLETAAEQALAGNMSQAGDTARSAREKWESGWNLCAAFTDHSPMEQIDGGFARLQLYEKIQDPTAFASVCVELAKQVEAIGDAHGAQWWNIL